MHKGVILLAKAENQDDAKAQVEEFLNDYEGDVWDWYQIGGRWTGTLDKYDPEKDENNIEICELCKGSGQRNDSLGKQARQKNPEYACNGCQGKGKSVKWPTAWKEHNGDILPLKDCLPIVSEWQQEYIKDGQAEEKKAAEWLAKDPKSYNMYGYSLRCAANIYQQSFSFDSNVFNIKSYDFNIPEDTTDWFAVIIDMHN